MPPLLSLLFPLTVSIDTAAHSLPAPSAHPSSTPSTNTERYVVKGTVVDETGQPLADASIRVEGTTQSTGTDRHGRFRLLLSEHGARTLHVSYVGYAPLRMPFTVSSTTAPLNLRLTPSAGSIGEAIVTGSRTERPLKDAPVITRIISRAEIDRIRPLDMQSLLQYTLPGIQFRYNSMSQTSTMTFQGMNSKMLTFLVDGERLSGESSDHNIDYNRLNPDDIERIEVVRGAASTLYDSNAQGGVINIITRRPTRPLSLQVDSRIAGRNGDSYGLNLGMRREHWSSSTSVHHRTRPTWHVEDTRNLAYEVVDAEGRVTPRESDAFRRVPLYGYTAWDAAQRFSFTCSDRLRIDLNGTYYNNVRPQRPDKKHHERYEDLTLGSQIRYLPTSHHQFDLTLHADHYVKRYVYPAIALTESPYRNRRHTARLNYTATLGAHTLSLGGEVAREHLRHYMLPDSGAVSALHTALYVQEDWQIVPRLRFVGGVRMDRPEGYAAHLTPKASILYRPHRVLTLRINYSHGYRPPTLKERYQEFNMMNIMHIYGNLELRPETSQQLSASIEAEHGGCHIAASAFHNRYQHYITYAYIRNDALQYINSDHRRTTGVEVSARYAQVKGMLFHATYNFIDDYNRREGYNLSTTRPHALTFGASYRHKCSTRLHLTGSLNGHWGARFTSYSYLSEEKAYARYAYPARTFCSLNLSASLPRHGVTAGVLIDNLFDHRDRATVATVQLPDLGRSVAVNLKADLATLFRR